MNTIKFVIDNHPIFTNAFYHDNQLISHHFVTAFMEHNYLFKRHRLIFPYQYNHEWLQAYHSAYILQELKMNSIINPHWRFLHIPDNGNNTKYIPDGLYINHITQEYISIQYKTFHKCIQTIDSLNVMINNYIVLNLLIEVGYFDNSLYNNQMNYLETNNFTLDSVKLAEEESVKFRNYSLHNRLRIYDEDITKNLLNEYQSDQFMKKSEKLVNEYKSYILKGNPHKYTCNVLEGDSLKIMQTFKE